MITEFNIKSLLGYLLPKGLPYFGNFPDNASPAGEDFPERQADFTYSFNNDGQDLSTYKRQLNDPDFYRPNTLGQPVFLPASIYWYKDGQLLSIEIPNPIVVISGRKKIKENYLAGKNAQGSIVETIGLQNYQITILATAITGDKSYPHDELKVLSDLWKRNEVLTLRNKITDRYLQKENNVIITNISEPDMRGITNAQVVQLSLISQSYFELEINE